MQFIYQIFVSCIISGEIEAITRIKIASVGLKTRRKSKKCLNGIREATQPCEFLHIFLTENAFWV